MLPPSSVCSVLLLVVTYLSYGVSCSKETYIDYRRPITVQITCCTAVSTAKIKFPIASYKIQQVANRCVYAVIFRTEANGSFCADPKARWVQEKVKKLSGGTVQLPRSRKNGGKGGKRGKGGKKPNNKNKKKIKNNTKTPVTSPWFPSTATATTVQTTS